MTSSKTALGCLVGLSASGCASFIYVPDGGAILNSPIETSFCRSSGVLQVSVVAQSAFAANKLVACLSAGLGQSIAAAMRKRIDPQLLSLTTDGWR